MKRSSSPKKVTSPKKSPLQRSSSPSRITLPIKSPTSLSPSSYKKNLLKRSQNFSKVLNDTIKFIKKLLKYNSFDYYLGNSDKIFERLFYPPTLDNIEFIQDKKLIKNLQESTWELMGSISRILVGNTSNSNEYLEYLPDYFQALLELYPNYLGFD